MPGVSEDVNKFIRRGCIGDVNGDDHVCQGEGSALAGAGDGGDVFQYGRGVDDGRWQRRGETQHATFPRAASEQTNAEGRRPQPAKKFCSQQMYQRKTLSSLTWKPHGSLFHVVVQFLVKCLVNVPGNFFKLLNRHFIVNDDFERCNIFTISRIVNTSKPTEF